MQLVDAVVQCCQWECKRVLRTWHALFKLVFVDDSTGMREKRGAGARRGSKRVCKMVAYLVLKGVDEFEDVGECLFRDRGRRMGWMSVGHGGGGADGGERNFGVNFHRCGGSGIS